MVRMMLIESASEQSSFFREEGIFFSCEVFVRFQRPCKQGSLEGTEHPHCNTHAVRSTTTCLPSRSNISVKSFSHVKSLSTRIECSFVIGVSEKKKGARHLAHLLLAHWQRTNGSLYERTHHEEHLALCIRIDSSGQFDAMSSKRHHQDRIAEKRSAS